MTKFTTISIYIIVSFLTIICAKLSQMHFNIDKKRFNKFWYILSFTIFTCFLCICKQGVDYEHYIKIFDNMQWNTLFEERTEIGFNIIVMLYKSFSSNATIFIILIKFSYMLIIYKSLYNLKEKIALQYSLMFIFALFYIELFYVFRQMLAFSILLYGISKSIRLSKKRYILIFTLIGALFHVSCLIGIGYFILVFTLERFKNASLNYKVGLYLIIPILSIGFLPNIIYFLVDNFEKLSYLLDYLNVDSSSKIGLGFLIDVIFISLAVKDSLVNNKNKFEQNIIITFFIMFLIIKISSYWNVSLMRANSLSSFIQIIIIPYIIKNKTNGLYCERNKNQLHFSGGVNKLFFFTYFLFLVITQIVGMQDIYGMNEIIFIWE